MADKLLFIIVSSDPQSDAELGSILSQAKVAAAMEFDVEVVFSGQCDRLAKKSYAEQSTAMIYGLIKKAYETGVRFKVCPQPFAEWSDELIPEVAEVVGSAYLISEAMNEDTTTFTY